MHRRPVAAIGGAIIALVATLLTLPGAGASSTAGPPGSPAGTASACQSNLNPADDTTMAVSAQQFVRSPNGIWTKGASLVRIPPTTSSTMNNMILIRRIPGPGPVPKVNIGVKADTPSGPHKPIGPNLAPGNMNIPPTSISTSAGYYNITTNLAVPVTFTAG